MNDFPVLGRRDYFNHAGCSPLPARVAAVMRDWVSHFEHDAYLGFDIPGAVGRLREVAARTIGASPDEVAVTHNTSFGINQVACGIDWRAGDRIVTTDVEYPANLYPWLEASRRHGLEVVRVPERTDGRGVARVDEAELLAAADHPRTRLVAVSHVQWGSGQRTDAARIGRWCRDRRVLLSLDVIQSMGVVPIDVDELHVDFLQSGSHKWWLGPTGAGILYVRREHVASMRPAVTGWANVVEPMKWEQVDETLQETAARFEYGTPALPSVVGALEGLTMLAEAGPEEVLARVVSLCDRFASGLRDRGYVVATPTDGLRSGMVCFTPPADGPEDAKGMVARLSKQEQTELACRCGRVRFSPHFYNTEAQVDRLLGRIDRVG